MTRPSTSAFILIFILIAFVFYCIANVYGRIENLESYQKRNALSITQNATLHNQIISDLATIKAILMDDIQTRNQITTTQPSEPEQPELQDAQWLYN